MLFASNFADEETLNTSQHQRRGQRLKTYGKIISFVIRDKMNDSAANTPFSAEHSVISQRQPPAVNENNYPISAIHWYLIR